MSDSLKTTLGDLVDSGEGHIQTGPFGSQLHARDYVEDGVPVVMPQQLGNNEIRLDGISRVGEQDRDRLARHVMREGDIVFSRRGDVTRRAYITAREDGWLCGTGCLLLRLSHPGCDNRYLVRFLGLHEARSHLMRHAIGATMPNLNQGILASVPVVLPSRKHQERIVEVVSAYDELIENNRRRIQLLDEAARLLYNEWFVHLRFPGHAYVSITDGVPDGWEKRSVADAIYVNPRDPVQDGARIRYVPMGALSTSGMVVDLSKSEIRTESTPVRFTNGDTLFARITPCLENGKTGYVNFLNQQEVGCGSTEFIVLRGREISPYFTYCFARTPAFRGAAIKSMIGSSGRQRVQVSCLREFVVPVPFAHLREKFDQTCEPLFREITVLIRQNEMLAEARDVLLRRLMNGEISV